MISRNCTNLRNHNQNRENFSFSRPWLWAYFLNGPNAAASIAHTLIRQWAHDGHATHTAAQQRASRGFVCGNRDLPNDGTHQAVSLQRTAKFVDSRRKFDFKPRKTELTERMLVTYRGRRGRRWVVVMTSVRR